MSPFFLFVLNMILSSYEYSAVCFGKILHVKYFLRDEAWNIFYCFNHTTSKFLSGVSKNVAIKINKKSKQEKIAWLETKGHKWHFLKHITFKKHFKPTSRDGFLFYCTHIYLLHSSWFIFVRVIWSSRVFLHQNFIVTHIPFKSHLCQHWSFFNRHSKFHSFA